MSAAAQQQPQGFAYCFEEIFMWHEAGYTQCVGRGLQPTPHFESAESKRRLHNLLDVTGTLDTLARVRARAASRAELARVHSEAYIDYIVSLSEDTSKGCHHAGDCLSISPGGFDIAARAAGAAIRLVDTVLGQEEGPGAASGGAGEPSAAAAAAAGGAYGLVRPPGHHASRDAGMGFCVFNNVAVAAAHALEARGLKRIAVVDFDVHHGNGTQSIFYDDPRVLVISIHQDSNYPVRSGPMADTGAGAGAGFTLNVPLPPGSGSGAYRAAFDRVVVPALDAYSPQLILVSAGFDASALDPLSSMMVTAADYRYLGEGLRAAAGRSCPGRVVALHEGGYSELYVPFCGKAFIEGLAGHKGPVLDPELADLAAWGYQELQPWQDAVIAAAERGPLAKLRAAARHGGGAAGSSGAVAA